MNKQQSIEDAFAKLGISKEQKKAILFVVNGFEPEVELDLVSVSRLLTYLLDQHEEGARVNAEMQVALDDAMERENALKAVVEAQRQEKAKLIEECERMAWQLENLKSETQRALATIAYYKRQLGMNSFLGRLFERVSLTVINIFNMTNGRWITENVTSTDVRGDMVGEKKVGCEVSKVAAGGVGFVTKQA